MKDRGEWSAGFKLCFMDYQALHHGVCPPKSRRKVRQDFKQMKLFPQPRAPPTGLPMSLYFKCFLYAC